MKNDASAAERIKNGASFGASSGEINENLREFWRQHTNKSVASGASLVTLSISGDILCADRSGSIFAKFKNFNMIGLFAELVVVRGGRRQDRAFAVRDKTDATTMTAKKIFIFKSKLPSFARIGVRRIIRDTKCDFTSRQTGEVVLNGLLKDEAGFNGAAKAVERKISGGYDG